MPGYCGKPGIDSTKSKHFRYVLCFPRQGKYPAQIYKTKTKVQNKRVILLGYRYPNQHASWGQGIDLFRVSISLANFRPASVAMAPVKRGRRGLICGETGLEP